MKDIIILPGIGGSGEAHWQTRWEKSNPEMRRFQPADWEKPDLADWISALERAVGASATPPLLVAHSLACLLVLAAGFFACRCRSISCGGPGSAVRVIP